MYITIIYQYHFLSLLQINELFVPIIVYLHSAIINDNTHIRFQSRRGKRGHRSPFKLFSEQFTAIDINRSTYSFDDSLRLVRVDIYQDDKDSWILQLYERYSSPIYSLNTVYGISSIK